MTQVRARVQCCRLGCRTSHEYYADISLSTHAEIDIFGFPKTTVEISMSPPGEGWVRDGHNVLGNEVYVCPDCVLKEKL